MAVIKVYDVSPDRGGVSTFISVEDAKEYIEEQILENEEQDNPSEMLARLEGLEEREVVWWVDQFGDKVLYFYMRG